jgi:hypothetical protein
MPIHDWTRVYGGIFHDFHHEWISTIKHALNQGLLPPDYYALAEQVAGGLHPDVLRKRNRVAIRHVSDDQVVALIEIVSPGNKTTRHALRAFVEKAVDFLEAGIHLLVLDLHPPGPHDPQGIHAAIWSEIDKDDFRLPPDKPLTLVSYSAGDVKRAFIDPVAVADELPSMPLFLEAERYVPVPLEATYRTAFAAVPKRWRDELDPPPAS